LVSKAELISLTIQIVDDENILTGFNAGLYAKIPVSKSFSIQPEIYYTTKGAEQTYNNALIMV
jgi:hypothetical protein